MNDDELLEHASKQLDLVLGFFPRVDAKASVVLAVDTGMLAFLATHVPSIQAINCWEIGLTVVTVLLITISLWFLYRGAFPSLKGGNASLVYFREIAARTEAKFIDEFVKQTSTDHAKDILGQVWRNSEILKLKFDALKIAFIFLALAIPPWVAALAIFSVKTVAQGGIAIH